MKSLERDIAFLTAAAADLEQYLFSSELFWPLNCGGKETRLTIGNIILTMDRLNVALLDKAQKEQFLTLKTGIAVVAKAWQVRWSQKATREFEARLHLWERFLDDVNDDPNGRKAEFVAQVYQRVILRRLLDEVKVIPAEDSVLKMAELDARLHRLSYPAVFVWETGQEKNYPPDSYWFLYVTL